MTKQRGFALARGIALQTYERKVSQLINFLPYLHSVIRQYEEIGPERAPEPPLAMYYVEPKATVEVANKQTSIPNFGKYVRRWLQDESARPLAIVGEYGTGKTCVCRRIMHDFATAYVANPGSTRIPLLFNLRDFTKTLSIEALITAFLDGVCGVPTPRFQLFKAMNEAGAFLLIFDGFDEMAVRVDADTLEINLREIEKLAVHPKSKVLLTSRIEYFVSAEEQARVLQPRGQLLATRDVEYQPVKLHPWDDARVALFLRKRVPLVPEAHQQWTFYHDQLKKIPGLTDLSRRPVLLEMIVKTLPQLIASRESIDRPHLYQTYLIGELKRQRVVKQRMMLLSEDTRLKILQDLAADFYEHDRSAITFSEALSQVESAIHPPRIELEAQTRDFLNCSFLVRERDEFKFSHRSMMEYLFARVLYAEIKDNKPRIFNRLKLDSVVSGFLVEMHPNVNTLWEWIDGTNAAREESEYLGGNAVSLLCMQDKTSLAGRDLAGRNLMGARFLTADLTRTNLEGAYLKGADLSTADISEDTLRAARVIDITLGVFAHWFRPRPRRVDLHPDRIEKLLHDQHSGTYIQSLY